MLFQLIHNLRRHLAGRGVCFFVLLLFLSKGMIATAFTLLSIKSSNQLLPFTLFFFIKIVFIKPLLETYFLQKLPLDFFSRYHSSTTAIILSAILFAFMHYDGMADVVLVFPCGLLLAIAYLDSPNRRHGFLFTFTIHATHNATVMALALLGNV